MSDDGELVLVEEEQLTQVGSQIGSQIASQKDNSFVTQITKNATFPQFYCVYLLQSTVKPRSFYIGSTNDPSRRLRQHNGLVKGGAHKTKKNGWRPWRMIVNVWGFPSKVSALQFEHAWQHPHITRLINADERISKGSGRRVKGPISLDSHLGNLRLLLSSSLFAKMGLNVRFLSSNRGLDSIEQSQISRDLLDSGRVPGVNEFNKDVHRRWEANKHKIDIPDTVDIDFSAIDDTRVAADIVEIVELAIQDLEHGDTRCSICKETIQRSQAVGCCISVSCSARSHLVCLANSMKEGKSGLTGEGVVPELKPLIPFTGTCHECSCQLHWPQVAQIAQYVRSYFLCAFDDSSRYL